MIRSTRCAWIEQNDVRGDRFLCGAAAAQMILYGRDDSKFTSAGSDTLKDSSAQLFADQATFWDKIIDVSDDLSLPKGVTFAGTGPNDPEQIVDDKGPPWATYPYALKKTLIDGVPGTVAGVAARVRTFKDEDKILPAIADSIDRGVAAALLIDGSHWVVVYLHHKTASGGIELHYRDGLLPRNSVTIFGDDESVFHNIDHLTAGVFKDKYIVVTAAASVPKRPGTTALPKLRLPKPSDQLEFRLKVEFTSAAAELLQAELLAHAHWASTFAGARIESVSSVTNLNERGMDYYLVDFVRPGRPQRRIGSVIVDPYYLRRRRTAGIETDADEMPPLIGREAALRSSVEAGIPGATLRPELVWLPTRESPTPFQPFYVVDESGRREPAAYVRADGKVFKSLTRMAGI